MTRDILDGVFTNLIHDIDGSRAALNARRELSAAATELEPGDPKYVGTDGATLGSQALALRTLANHLHVAARNRARERAAQYGWNVATHVIAPIAKDPANTNAVTWITGNRYMPPIRDLAEAERLWVALDTDTDMGGELWGLFMEAIEQRLTELDVLMDAPEYDNALYVVDTSRWERKDANDEDVGDDMNDEWRAIEPA
jgi:hypothetical protein